MINTGTVDNVLNKLNLNDYTFNTEKQDDSGDFIQMFCPELDFKLIKSAILKTKFFQSNINDIGPDAIYMTLKDVDGGFDYLYTLKVVSGGPFGTRISAATKRINYFNSDGEYKPFISFEMMSNYLTVFGNKL